MIFERSPSALTKETTSDLPSYLNIIS